MQSVFEQCFLIPKRFLLDDVRQCCSYGLTLFTPSIYVHRQ